MYIIEIEIWMYICHSYIIKHIYVWIYAERNVIVQKWHVHCTIVIVVLGNWNIPTVSFGKYYWYLLVKIFWDITKIVWEMKKKCFEK